LKFRVVSINRNDNDRYDEESELLSILNDRRSVIRQEIESQLYHKISEIGSVQKLEVELRFESGSILATGWVIITILGEVAGAISFFEYLNRLRNYIKEACQQSISRHLPGSVSKYKVSIHVEPTGHQDNITSNSISNKTPDLFNISSSQLLLYITLINIVLFLGGTLFMAIKVPSVLEKYNEAEAKFREAEARYDSADFMLKNTKLDYQIKQQEIEQVKSEVLLRKEAIINSLSTDTFKIGTHIADINTQLVVLSDRIKKLDDNRKRYNNSLKGLNESIEKLQKNKVTFSLPEVWHFLNGWLKVMVVAILTSSYLTFVIAILFVIRGIRS
jgi:hypothetical protein